MKQPVVFDIDGTLTAEPYTADNILKVKENPAMVFVAKTLQDTNPLVISTARPERWRKETEKWLKGHGLDPEAVYMRDDSRTEAADQMIKFGHLRDIRERFGEPVIWVDDNPSNVNMLKSNGVPVIHVQE